MNRVFARIVNAVRGQTGAKPRTGLVVGQERSDYGAMVMGDLDPARFRRLLEAALRGDGREVNDVYDHILRLDGHLRSVVAKRRSAMRRLDWEIIAAQADEGDDAFDADRAAEIAQHCRRVLRRCHGLAAALDHLNDAVGRGVAAVEIEWATDDGQRRPVRALRVPHGRLTYDSMDPWRLRISSEGDWRGFAVDELPAGKFIVHVPEGEGASAMAAGLLLPSAWLVVFKRFGWTFYFQTLEMFGAPMVTATYPPGASSDVIRSLLEMLDRIGKFRSGAFPQGTDFAYHEPAAGGGKNAPHLPAIELCNAEMSKLWLGGTLMTEVGATGGNRAVADVQNEGLAALRDDDAFNESATITEQLLRPIVMYEFGSDALGYVPTWRRVVERHKDVEQMARVAGIAVNELQASIPQRYVRDELGLPLTDDADPEAPLAGRRTGFEGLGFGPTIAGGRDAADETSADRLAASARGAAPSLRTVAHSLLDTIRRRGGSLAAIVPWMMAAVQASQAHTAAVAESIGAVLKREEASIASEADVGLALGDAFAALPIEDMVSLARHALVAGELAGRARALEKMSRRAMSSQRAAIDRDHERLVHAAKIDFARIPFVAAIERLRDRIGIDPVQFTRLEAEARSRAWRVAGVWNMDLLAVLHTQLVSAIAAGETVRDFRQSVIGQMYDRAGWTGENPWHANVVFFQNFAMSHAAGRWREYTEAGVGHWRFVANGESCEICTPEVGKVYAMADTIRYPPLHFNCDCEDEPVFEGEVAADAVSSGIDMSDNLSLFEYRQKPSAFVWRPASYAAFTPLNLRKYPDALRPAFAAFAVTQGWEVVE